MSKRTRALGAAQRRLTPAQLVRSYKVGDLVILDHQSRYEGMPHPRYRGRVGKILKARGKAYEVGIVDGNAKKVLVVPSVHLQLKTQN
ncbi:MAG: 50S ribosomal protein L21e [Candidatus Micrarchaeota archaeon]|nr:50S ribosomal protein L21e [Candidatus Micrarchaeota archaeon]